MVDEYSWMVRHVIPVSGGVTVPEGILNDPLVPYCIVDIENRGRGKQVLLSTEDIRDVDVLHADIVVDLPAGVVRDKPEITPDSQEEYPGAGRYGCSLTDE
ncbi:MAG: hypothetical protein ABIF77_15325 [bacterium]